MLRIKTTIKASKIHNIGLFVEENIEKGTIIAELNNFDIKIKDEDIPNRFLELFDHYFSVEGNYYQTYFDNMRFMNHSDSPNCIDSKDGKTIAIKDIKIGDELTCDYSFFCDSYKKQSKNFENKFNN